MPMTKLPLGARPKAYGTNLRDENATAARDRVTERRLESDPSNTTRRQDLAHRPKLLKSNPRKLQDPKPGIENDEPLFRAKSANETNKSKGSGNPTTHNISRSRYGSGPRGGRSASANRGRGGSRGGRGRRAMSSTRSQGPNRGLWRGRPLDTTRLIELLGREPEEIVMELATEKSGFKELLNETNMPKELVILLLELMVKACSCTSSPVNVNSFLAIIVWHSVFLTTHLVLFVPSFTHSVSSTTAMKGSSRQELVDVKPIDNLITVLKELLIHLPTSYSEVNIFAPLLQSVLQDNPSIPGETKSRVDEIAMILKSISEDNERRMTKSQHKHDKAPPNDFREIRIIPGINELGKTKRPFLRQNLIKGKYNDVDHYLDVQFRLLREDFVAPLREGIAEYLEKQEDLEDNPNERLQDIRLYFNVHIIRPSMTRSGPGHVIQFDTSMFRGIRWESTKRLIQGSLLCLTSDKFKTVIFATVEERDVSSLQKGQVEVKFVNRGEVLGVAKDLVFLMAETSAYFEAYRHVLGGLQEYNKNNLPMKSYIIEASAAANPPGYLLGDDSDSRYDLRPLVLNTETEQIQSTMSILRAVDVLEPSQWPDGSHLHFDDSQLAAYQAALSSEFVLIQGPPGTGKTYVGLKIVKTLLHNYHSWSYDNCEDKWDTRPILVVCYTNHALDQFLEGIYNYEKEIIRVGGRCSSETLQERTIFNIRQQQKEDKEVPEYIRRRKADLKEYYELRTILQTANDRIRLAQTGILSAAALFEMDIIPLKQYRSLLNQREPLPDPMYDWLGLDGKGLQKVPKQRKDKSDDSGEQGANDVISDDESDEELDIDEEAELLAQQRQLGNDPTFQKLRNKSRMKLSSEFVFLPGKRRGALESQGAKHKRRQAERSIEFATNSSDVMTLIEMEGISDCLWDMYYQQRWKLYRSWLREYIDRQELILWLYHTAFERLSEERKEIEREEDYLLLKKARVIGMTTTGAAKNRILLQRIRPRIIVVEEAAEVLEAHIITTLSKDCQHLILIGDHQQLRPNPTVYRLAKHFDLDVSLFERMINNGLPCHRLSLQHRMRPEISILMKEHFYKGLDDHSDVTHYKSVMGVSKNIFFLEHDHKENRVGDTRSKSNLHEAQFLVKLCQYLLKQGYSPPQITILTTYTGQLLNFKKLMDKDTFEGVRVSVVDNYQGEENDIILLSLVRSNEDGSIGFLKVHNRVCVALSRAREGLFCIGNIRLLAEKSDLWRGILKTLESPEQVQGSMERPTMQRNRWVGSGLPLVCQNHPETITEVSCADDFLKVPDGGCMLPCKVRLECGHACEQHCHPYDPEHEEYKCKRDCVGYCHRGHQCPLRCYEECNCPVILTKTFSVCQHKERIPCYRIETATCQRPCMTRLPCTHPCPSTCGEDCPTVCNQRCLKKISKCSHSCTNKCGRPCTTWQRCKVKMEITLPKCGHKTFVECKDNPAKRLIPQYPTCTHFCDRKMKCGHKCNKLCKDPCATENDCQIGVTKTWPTCEHSFELECNKARYALCGERCERQLTCGHRCPKVCHEQCELAICEEPCQRVQLPCKHTCPNRCGEPCATRCTQNTLKTLPDCEHAVRVPCHVDVESFECKEPCQRALPCNHVCKKVCGKPCTILCMEKTVKTLSSCGHKMSLSCFQNPEKPGLCRRKCLTRFPCGHFCRRLCRETCEEKCETMVNKVFPDCKHEQEIPCSTDIASVKCLSDCRKVLLCGHKCAAKCREQCTAYCRVKVIKDHPKCGHLLRLMCHEDPGTAECKRQCKRTLLCGQHRCTKLCSELCESICKATVTKTMKCGHEIRYPCNENPDDLTCHETCKDTLSCGHPCSRECAEPCQPANTCRHICMKPLPRCGHPCPKECAETCATAICRVKVTKKIPGCGHKAEMLCSKDPARAICNMLCQKKMSCGLHRCLKVCSQQCDDVCEYLVTKQISGCEHEIELKCHVDPAKAICFKKVNKVIQKCGHVVKISCHLDPDTTRRICEKQCEEKLPCGHPCQEKCGRPCTTQCKAKVPSMLLPCNHLAKDVACYIEPESILCKERCVEALECGHDCKNTCGECSHRKKTRGTALRNCAEICQKTLRCGHKCRSNCGDCHGGRFHRPCLVQTNVILLCGCTVLKQCSKALSAHRNPNNRSNNREKSEGRCLLQYIPGERSSTEHRTTCQHNVFMCNQPCEQSLPCKHICIGICGEPCLKLCRFCNRREVLKISPISRPDRDPCYIELKKCGHIFESSDLDRQLNVPPAVPFKERCSPIVPVTCSKCHRVISDKRYTEHKVNVAQLVKIAYQHTEDQQSIAKQNASTKLLELTKYTFKCDNVRSRYNRQAAEKRTKRRPEPEMAWKLFLLKALETIGILRLPSTTVALDNLLKRCRQTLSSVLQDMRRRLEGMLDDGTILTEQMAEDICCELERSQWCEVAVSLITDEFETSVAYRRERKTNWIKIVDIINSGRRFNSERRREAVALLSPGSRIRYELVWKKFMSSKYGGPRIPDIMKMQRQQTGFLVGDWYTCSRGHVFHRSRIDTGEGAQPLLNGEQSTQNEDVRCPNCEGVVV